jgi:hypothetical protein
MENNVKPVRENMIFKVKIIFRTEWHQIVFRNIEIIRFVRNMNGFLIDLDSRTNLLPILKPGATLLRRLPRAKSDGPSGLKKTIRKDFGLKDQLILAQWQRLG